jgi:hypothetical protein
VVAAAHGRGRQPLREKLTLFWHSHFATSIQKVRQPRLMYQQNELLRTAGAVAALRPWEALLDAADREPLEPGTGVLVLVTLYGGNDGLNTVIPYDDRRYQDARPELAYKAEQVLGIGDGLGLNPSLKRLKGLWDDHRLAVVQGVGYPNPNRSHFRSMDIWQTGSPDSPSHSGWLGRWLDATGTDPLRAVGIGATLPVLLAGEKTVGAAVPLGPLAMPAGARGRPSARSRTPSRASRPWPRAWPSPARTCSPSPPGCSRCSARSRRASRTARCWRAAAARAPYGCRRVARG